MSTSPLTIHNAVSRLQEAIPEVASAGEYYADLPHDAFGAWSGALCQWLRDPSREALVQRCAAFIDEMGVCEDHRVRNVLLVSVLETIRDDDIARANLEPRLGPAARAMLAEEPR